MEPTLAYTLYNVADVTGDGRRDDFHILRTETGFVAALADPNARVRADTIFCVEEDDSGMPSLAIYSDWNSDRAEDEMRVAFTDPAPFRVTRTSDLVPDWYGLDVIDEPIFEVDMGTILTAESGPVAIAF